MISVLKNSLEQSLSGIFELFEDIFYFMIHYGFADENFCLLCTVMCNQRFKEQEQPLDFVTQHDQYMMDLFFNASFQCRSFYIHSKDDLQHVLDILMCMTKKAAVDTYYHPNEKEAYMERYQNKINRIKYGI